MAVETYTRRPAGLKHPVTKYRVRIRTKIDGAPVVVDELYDTISEANAAHQRHWISIRTGKASDDLADTLKRLSEPAIEIMCAEYVKKVSAKHSPNSLAFEKIRLEKTIPNVYVWLGRLPDEAMFRPSPQSIDVGGKTHFRFGDILASRCPKEAVIAYIGQRAMTVSDETIKRELGLLSLAFDYFPDHFPGHTAVNPVKLLKKNEKPTSGLHRERVLSPDEEVKLLAVCDAGRSQQMGLAVRIALGTAMRRSEIIHLNWNMVDFDTRIIRLDKDKAIRAGYRRVRRKVAMFPIAFDALQRQWLAEGKPDCGLVFGYTPEGFNSTWKRYSKLAELVDFHFHDLRHTCITRAATAGLSVVQTAAALGIADVRHLEKRSFDQTEAAAEKVHSGQTLNSRELASISGHGDIAMLKRYANVDPSSVAKSQNENQAQEPSRPAVPAGVSVRKEGKEFIVTIDGIEGRGKTTAEAMALAKELKSLLASE